METGGLIEISSKEVLQFFGEVDARAFHGKIGTLRLDHTEIHINEVGPTARGLFSGGNPNDFTSTEPNAIIRAGHLTSSLSKAHVILQTKRSPHGDIVVTGDINWGGAGTLTLHATRNLHISSHVQAEGGIDLKAGEKIWVGNEFEQVRVGALKGTTSFEAKSVHFEDSQIGWSLPTSESITGPIQITTERLTLEKTDIGHQGAQIAADISITSLEGLDLAAGKDAHANARIGHIATSESSYVGGNLEVHVPKGVLALTGGGDHSSAVIGHQPSSEATCFGNQTISASVISLQGGRGTEAKALIISPSLSGNQTVATTQFDLLLTAGEGTGSDAAILAWGPQQEVLSHQNILAVGSNQGKAYISNLNPSGDTSLSATTGRVIFRGGSHFQTPSESSSYTNLLVPSALSTLKTLLQESPVDKKKSNLGVIKLPAPRTMKK